MLHFTITTFTTNKYNKILDVKPDSLPILLDIVLTRSLPFFADAKIAFLARTTSTLPPFPKVIAVQRPCLVNKERN